MTRQSQQSRTGDAALRRATITILHTNDIHGHLVSWRGWEGELSGQTVGRLAPLAARVRGIRDEVGPEKALLLDAGDTIGDTQIAAETEGRAVIETMNAMSYDAMVVGNHSHNRMKEALRVGRTVIVQAGAHGSDLGRLDLTVENGRVVSHRRTLIPMTGEESDRSVAEVIARWSAPFERKMSAPIGRAKTLIARAQTIAGQEPEKTTGGSSEARNAATRASSMRWSNRGSNGAAKCRPPRPTASSRRRISETRATR